jgi:hypothetical protein
LKRQSFFPLIQAEGFCRQEGAFSPHELILVLSAVDPPGAGVSIQSSGRIVGHPEAIPAAFCTDARDTGNGWNNGEVVMLLADVSTAHGIANSFIASPFVSVTLMTLVIRLW